MTSQHNREVLEKTYQVAQARGLTIEPNGFAEAMFALNAEPTTKTWQERCTPIENWIKGHPQLMWFIDAERVANEGAETSIKIKKETPNLSKEEFLNKMFEIWYHKLLEFATMFGYPN